MVTLLLCLVQGGKAASSQGMRGIIGYDTSDGLPNNWIKDVVQDKSGYIWVATNEGICRFDGNGFHVPSFVSCQRDFSRNINDLYVGEDNVLWAATDESLLSLDLKTNKTTVVRTGVRALCLTKDSNGNLWCVIDDAAMRYGPDNSWHDYRDVGVRRICSSNAGQIWMTSNDGSLFRFDSSDDSFKKLPEQMSLPGNTKFNLMSCLDERTLILSSSSNDVFLFDTATGKWNQIFDSVRDADGALVLSVCHFLPYEFFVATDSGLYCAAIGKKSARLSFDLPDGSSLSDNLRCLFVDDENRVWIGTFFNGLCCSYLSSVESYSVAQTNHFGTLTGEVVRAMCEDGFGNVWAATENGTVEGIAPDGQIVSYTSKVGFPANANFQAIGICQGHLFIGSYGFGVYEFDPRQGVILRHYDVGANNCVKIACSKDGTIYAGTSDGLYMKSAQSEQFKRVDSVGSGFVHALCFDDNNNLWIGFYRGGLIKYNPVYDEALAVTPKGMSNSFSSMKITDVMKAGDGRIWATTEGEGVYVLSEGERGEFDAVHIDKHDGLPSNIACSVIEDSSGNIWIATIGGVVVANTGMNIVRIPDFRVGHNQFRYGSVLKTRSGRVFLGSTRGVVSFIPDEILNASHHLEIADVYKVTDGTMHTLNIEGPVTLSFADASITIRLTNHKANLGEGCQFEYTLTSRRAKRMATSVTKDNFITYVNLEPGSYVFNAKVIGDAVQSDCVQRVITVRPPVYASTGAKVVYSLVSFATMILLIMYFRRKYRMQAARKAELLEMEKQKEAYESKLAFFTNISHEIRTPLTLIKIPVDKMIANHSYAKESEEDMGIVKANADRLLGLVNQLLDLRKYEGAKRELYFTEVDIVELVSGMCREFARIAENVGVSFKYSIPEEPVKVKCSQSSVDKILRNLFMNAVKYCSKNVLVALSAESDVLRIVVDSDGSLIPPAEREKIFEPFYQLKMRSSNISSAKGTGIGLALSKSLATMNGGDVILDWGRMDCNSFVLTLPLVRKDSECQLEPIKEEVETSADEEDSGDRFTILVVEDDRELNRLLVKELSSDYRVLHAYDGKEAVEVLKKKPVGLVVSDVVMPEMDGCALCDYIKNEVEFSHIPVVLMTAVTGSESQLSSLQSGADYYLPKPFSMEVLKASIFNLLKNREIVNNQFSTKPFYMETAASGARDEAFMEKLNAIVMENLANPQFGVFDLADQMSVSRSTLFRKVKANTGQNVNEYIKICRLKKATELLASNRYMIKEISYMVGFSSSSYFAKEFKNQFGISPSSICADSET